MSTARTLIMLNERRPVKQSEPWNSTSGIYADFKDGFDKPKYYCKCPKCHFVHGFYATPREAIARKLCNLCKFQDVEKLKKEVHQVAFAESANEGESEIDPTDYINSASDWEAELKRLGFEEQTVGCRNWYKQRSDGYYVIVWFIAWPTSGMVRVQLIDRSNPRHDREITTEVVPQMSVAKHVLNLLRQKRRTENLTGQLVGHLLA